MCLLLLFRQNCSFHLTHLPLFSLKNSDRGDDSQNHARNLILLKIMRLIQNWHPGFSFLHPTEVSFRIFWINPYCSSFPFSWSKYPVYLLIQTA